MEQFQLKTELIFARLTLENAVDRQDWEEALRMSRRIDFLSAQRLQCAAAQAEVTA